MLGVLFAADRRSSRASATNYRQPVMWPIVHRNSLKATGFCLSPRDDFGNVPWRCVAALRIAHCQLFRRSSEIRHSEYARPPKASQIQSVQIFSRTTGLI
jgi:hypothetical protein